MRFVDPAFSVCSRLRRDPVEPPSCPLSVEELLALIESRHRQVQLTEGRVLDLAELPVPLVAGWRREEARRRLLAIADFFFGRR